MTPFSEFYLPLRMLLGDNDPYGVFQFTNQMLDAGLRAVLMMGMVPGYTPSADNSMPPVYSICPDVPAGIPYALMVFESARMLISGDQGSFSFSTRALSQRVSGDRQRTVIMTCIQKIYELRDEPAVFSSREKIVAFINALGDIGDTMEINLLVPSNITLDYSAGIVQPAVIE